MQDIGKHISQYVREKVTYLMDRHVPPHTACSREDHATLPTLKHPRALVTPQMVVQATPRYELLAALVTDERSLPGVASGVLFQVTVLLECCSAVVTVILPLLKLSFTGVVDRAGGTTRNDRE